MRPHDQPPGQVGRFAHVLAELVNEYMNRRGSEALLQPSEAASRRGGPLVVGVRQRDCANPQG